MVFWLPSPVSNLTKAKKTQWDNFPQENKLKDEDRQKRGEKFRVVCIKDQSASLSLVLQATNVSNWLLAWECLPDHLSSPVTTHGRLLWVWICVCAQKHTPSLVWASNEGGDLWRESAFFWVLAGILVHIPFYLLSLGDWYGGGVCLVEEIIFPWVREGTERTRQDMKG